MASTPVLDWHVQKSLALGKSFQGHLFRALVFSSCFQGVAKLYHQCPSVKHTPRILKERHRAVDLLPFSKGNT